MNPPTPLLIEVGNTTVKVCTLEGEGGARLRRFDELRAAQAYAAGSPQIVVDPAGMWGSQEGVRSLHSNEFGSFVGSAYNTPSDLGLDRVLNLIGMDADGIVVSCGTAITVDAVFEGRPTFGAILPGFTTSADALHNRIPTLPAIQLTHPVGLPARTPAQSVANGIVLGTTHAIAGLVRSIAALVFASTAPYMLVLTGGDARLAAGHFPSGDLPAPVVDDLLLFRGIARHAGLL